MEWHPKLAKLRTEWSGGSVVVVGGGPSRNAWRTLRDEIPDLRVISCNEHAAGDADIVVSRDPVFQREALESLDTDAIKVYVSVSSWEPEDPSLIRLERIGARGWSTDLDRGVYGGGVSGYCAAQIADALVGAMGTVYLAGFDFGQTAVWRSYLSHWEDARPLARFIQLAPSSPLQFIRRGHRFIPVAQSRPEPGEETPGRIGLDVMQGLGDSIYIRPFVARLAMEYEEVWVRTAWPQLYMGLGDNVRFHNPVRAIGLRTQDGNLNREETRAMLGTAPRGIRWHKSRWTQDQLRRGLTIIEGLEESFGLGLTAEEIQAGMGVPVDYSASETDALLERHGVPARSIWSWEGPGYAVIRPATIRSEWPAPGRNPQMGVIPAMIRAGMEAFPDLVWVSVAHLADEEWLEEPLPDGVVQLHSGELDVLEVAALIDGARFAIGAPGFIIPMAIGLGTPLWTVYGGAFPPAQVVDPRMWAGEDIPPGQSVPVPSCGCIEPRHNCPKPLDQEAEVERFLQWVRWTTCCHEARSEMEEEG